MYGASEQAFGFRGCAKQIKDVGSPLKLDSFVDFVGGLGTTFQDRPDSFRFFVIAFGGPRSKAHTRMTVTSILALISTYQYLFREKKINIVLSTEDD